MQLNFVSLCNVIIDQIGLDFNDAEHEMDGREPYPRQNACIQVIAGQSNCNAREKAGHEGR